MVYFGFWIKAPSKAELSKNIARLLSIFAARKDLNRVHKVNPTPNSLSLPMEYNPSDIESTWQGLWSSKKTYQTGPHDSGKPKYYVLDMFPYPSGAGLHVGHPLGYIASDIVSRFKRAQGFNVLHPMGFDAFGLPAEQYAIETGQHPAKTTAENIARYIEQLKKIGFSYDWDREIRTCEPEYYKWTQFIFLQLFDSWYNKKTDKAEAIADLISAFEANGNQGIEAACDEDTPSFSASDWASWNEAQQSEMLLKYRLAFVAETFVNWCPGLGTVLANDEVKDGFSERGGFPVERKQMLQWSLRITAYAERLLKGLDTLDWSDAVKEMQRNWIGKSQGASLWFEVEGIEEKIEVFTTRIDTTFGVTFLSLAPEHPLVEKITTPGQKEAVDAYLKYAQSRSERDRMADVKTISGTFTGAYAINPFNGAKVPIWIADYVLAGYGTGAVMAVPSSDTRDYAFAKHFGLDIIQVQEGPQTDISQDDFDAKAGTMINSGFLNGLPVKEAIAKAVAWAEEKGIGKGKTNFRMRDAIFGRQRYWGEPVPVYYENGIPKALKTSDLPLILPEIDQFKPTETGEPPLGRAVDWKYTAPQPPKGEFKGAAGAIFLSKSPRHSWPEVVSGQKILTNETADPFSYELLKEYSRKMRYEASTESENLLWLQLSNKNLEQFKFRRQHIVGQYIADFICLKYDLIIEVDGLIHQLPDNKKADEERTAWLNENGFHVLRFTNREIHENMDGVLNSILFHLTQQAPPSGAERASSAPPSGAGGAYELSTMPGWAGSSWYFLRYMDPKNEQELVSKEAEAYWQSVDLYIGGTEHATGHLLYSRFWHKFLKDRGFVSTEEPFQKLVNQGMIQGRSNVVYRLAGEKTFVSKGLIGNREVSQLYVDVNIVKNDVLDIEAFHKWRTDYADATFELEDGQYICGWEVEKMSKSKYNVVNPDDICAEYGADTLRLYEMFLGPLEQSKPWNTNGIEGVFRFLRKLWNLFDVKDGKANLSTEAPTKEELKALHKVIKKTQEDIENLSLNTSVSSFMVAVNELSALKCNKKAILTELLVVIAPYAPHICEELWFLSGMGGTGTREDAAYQSVTQQTFPTFNPAYLVDDEVEYPISVNGKVRAKLVVPADTPAADVEKQSLALEAVQKWMEGKPAKKVIVVPKKIVNVVI
jgi:leucyl-tRNA synthetase/very-short-patch-repair endonuclease